MKFRNAIFAAFLVANVIGQAFFCQTSAAAFTFSIDPATLVFNGNGNHTVNVLISHDGTGLSTFSGLTVRFGSAADASLSQLPTGAIINSVTRGAVFNGELFDFDVTNNDVAMSTLTAADSDVGASQTVTLFTMEFNLQNRQSYDIGVDFRGAQRGNLLPFGSPSLIDISDEFFNPNSPNTDFQFTLTNAVAVPEPGSLLVLAGMGAGGVYFRKRKAHRLGMIPTIG